MARARHTNNPNSTRKKTCTNKRKFPSHGAAHAAMMICRDILTRLKPGAS